MATTPKRIARRQQFVDRQVQGAIALRCIGYWFFCLLTVVFMLLIWRIFTGPARLFYTHFDEMWFQYGPALVASLLLLPIIVVDSVRVSNRFAGPIVRLRRAMKQLAAGEKVQPLTFREDDYWRDLAENFNAVLKQIELRQRSAESAASDQEELVGAGR